MTNLQDIVDFLEELKETIIIISDGDLSSSDLEAKDFESIQDSLDEAITILEDTITSSGDPDTE